MACADQPQSQKMLARSVLLSLLSPTDSFETHTMSQTSRVAPTVEELPLEIAELGAALAALPPESRSRIEAQFQQVVESTRRRRRILNLVQEALSQLRLDMKYLMFDLEATRRERDGFQRQVEERQKGDE